jgi:hypothetical protein
MKPLLIVSLLVASLAAPLTASAQPVPASLSVTRLSSAPPSARPGRSYLVRGSLLNTGAGLAGARVVAHLLRVGSAPLTVGRQVVPIAAHTVRDFALRVTLPRALRNGSYALVACVRLSCVTAERHLQVGPKPRLRLPAIAAARGCSSGAHTLSTPGMHVYPETGNGGYRSVHSDVYLSYDAANNLFLPGTHVVLTDQATQCLTDFSLDFERTSADPAGPNLSVGSVSVNGRPASFTFVQPTYPGDPNGQNDPDPRAHEAAEVAPVGGPENNPLPPACTPELLSTNPNKEHSLDGTPCPANKLVITPAQPIAAGTSFTVEVDYTGRPGVHDDGDGTTEGWFAITKNADAGGFVTTEPVATEDWMPLNDHPSAKPTYDVYDTVALGKTAIANGELVSQATNLPDANFPGGSTTWHWHSPEGIASYLVENSIGSYTLNVRLSPTGIQYYEAQDSTIPKQTAAANKAIMDQQEDIVGFQSQFNGAFPFTTDGVIIGTPAAGFEEEMQTKITFANSSIDLDTLHHENMHQWWGDNVSEASYNLTFFKEGLATFGEFLYAARIAPDFEQSLVNTFDSIYDNTKEPLWNGAPSDPRPFTLFSGSKTYDRPGISYIALRAILGPANFDAALQEIQGAYRQSSITEPQLESGFAAHLPSQTPACRAELGMFFAEWWDTTYPTASGLMRPDITGPGLEGGGFHC